MSNIFKLCPTHFSRGGEKNFRGGFAPPGNGRVNICDGLEIKLISPLRGIQT